MLLNEVVETSQRVAATRKRLEKISYLADCLRRLDPDEIEIGASYLTGVLPQGRIGVGYALLSAAAAGEHAPAPTLSLLDVDRRFADIATTAGRGSAKERRRRLGELFSRATSEEQEFLVRLVGGELRQGALEGIFVDALARASGIEGADVRRAVMVAGDSATVAKAALSEGAAGLAHFSIQVLQPVRPMLAQPAGDPSEALERLGRAAFELKIDGARVQVHKSGDDVRVFSRKLNEVTAAVPEVVDLARAIPARDIVLDGEVIALEAEGAPHAFQTTMRRFGRKLDVERMRAELPLSSYFFDCLYLDGRDLTALGQSERVEAMRERLAPGAAIPRIVTAEAEEADTFLADALARGHEGVMAKGLDSAYEAGRRGGAWLKIKLAQTLDLVVLAAEWGHGRRHGYLSNLHLGARDPKNGGFVMLGKTFKGMTDEMLAWQTNKLGELAIASDDWTVHVRPELVVEIAYNDLQASPHYPGGLALRFARVKRYRLDKRAEDADTIETVRAAYARGRAGEPARDVGGDADYGECS